MNKRPFAFLMVLHLLLNALLIAEETAVVTENKINVRGQPSFIGEVVTQLERGEQVTVLERITVENPKPGEPSVWAKIKLPPNTPVWVFAPFVKDGAVSVNRLNVRAGPGENYSVLGRIPHGTQVIEIRTVEDWMEIEAPPDVYAFIDSSLVKTHSGDQAPTVAETASEETAKPESLPEEKAVPSEKDPVSASSAEPETEEPSAVAQTQPEPAPAEVAQIPEPVEVAPAQDALAPSTSAAQAETAAPVSTPTAPVVAPPPVSVPQEPLPRVAEAPPAQEEQPLPKRIVRREGIVRSTRSIQAPTWYELVHPKTKRTINYLHEEKLGVNLKPFRGLRVVVTGEELIDARWRDTPVLELDSIEAAP